MFFKSKIEKTVLVTGSGRGIGRASALMFGEMGAMVVVHDIDEKYCIETTNLIKNSGGRAIYYQGDVADIERMKEIVVDISESLGGVDILVNNAGISSDRCPLEEVTLDMFQRSIDVHVKGTLFTTQAVIPYMKRKNCGRIVNISSIQALTGWSEGATYNAAKGAIIALTKGWAKEFAPWNITVNVVAPGHTETEMTVKNDPIEVRRKKAESIPLKRYAKPEEMAAAIIFLCSDYSRFITGQILSPNGGFLI
jgi:3-oxoacyl-[acyl-carrier protein] reductase